MNKIIEIIDEIYTEVKTLNEGKVADYMPVLAYILWMVQHII
jgi:glutaminase